jgi:ssDNA-binding Zn-finger/Zn-ribbon topoisomerase 1
VPQKDDQQVLDEGGVLEVTMRCSICNAWPIIEFTSNRNFWKQATSPIPSNRICIHLLHFLTCPTCNFTTETEKEQAKRYAIPKEFRDRILKRDDYTCQACGYHQPEGPKKTFHRPKGLSSAAKLYTLFTGSLKWVYSKRQLHVAHYHTRYGSVETPENRLNPLLARTLCAECHGMESALHAIERWNKRREHCPILQRLE